MRVSAPRLQPQQTTPVVERNTVGATVAKVGQQIGQAAFLLAEKDALMAAREANLQYQSVAQELWTGGQDANGDFQPGYAATTGKAGALGYDLYRQKLESARMDIANNLDEASKSRFLAESQYVYTNYINQGAAHASGSRKKWERQQISDTWQRAFVSAGDKLTVGDTEGAVNTLIDTTDQLSNSVSIDPSVLPELKQKAYRNFYDYLATQPGSSMKLSQVGGIIPDQDLITQTHLQNKIRDVTRREITERRQLEIDSERKSRKAREEAGIALRTKVWDGETIDEPTLNDMLRARKIDASTHDYLVNVQRGRVNIQPLSGTEMYTAKGDILNGLLDSEDIDRMNLNTQDNKALHGVLLSSQHEETRRGLQNIRAEITRLGSDPLYGKGRLAIAAASEEAERIYLKSVAEGKPLSTYEVTQKVGSLYFNAQLMQQQAPEPIVIEGEVYVPATSDDWYTAFNRYKAISATLDDSEQVEYLRLFTRWKRKIEAGSALEVTRNQDLQETTR